MQTVQYCFSDVGEKDFYKLDEDERHINVDIIGPWEYCKKNLKLEPGKEDGDFTSLDVARCTNPEKPTEQLGCSKWTFEGFLSGKGADAVRHQEDIAKTPCHLCPLFLTMQEGEDRKTLSDCKGLYPKGTSKLRRHHFVTLEEIMAANDNNNESKKAIMKLLPNGEKYRAEMEEEGKQMRADIALEFEQWEQSILESFLEYDEDD
ncbi:hypothetical protein MMC10_005063 [Thelotrema lepadinum]|nr:hypothetical protein [Thelotrema lepadinum]